MEWDGDFDTEIIDLASIWNVSFAKAKRLLLTFSYTDRDFEISFFSYNNNAQCKVCNSSIEISLIRLHVAKHILSGKVKADVCGFFRTSFNYLLGLRLSSGTKAKVTYSGLQPKVYHCIKQNQIVNTYMNLA